MTNKEALEILEQMRSQIENDRRWLALSRAIGALNSIERIKFNAYALNELINELGEEE